MRASCRSGWTRKDNQGGAKIGSGASREQKSDDRPSHRLAKNKCPSLGLSATLPGKAPSPPGRCCWLAAGAENDNRPDDAIDDEDDPARVADVLDADRRCLGAVAHLLRRSWGPSAERFGHRKVDRYSDVIPGMQEDAGRGETLRSQDTEREVPPIPCDAERPLSDAQRTLSGRSQGK